MPHTIATATAHTEPLPPTSKEPFPLRAVLLAVLIPALLGSACALFIAPPVINADPAIGLMSWLNFVEGGTWNTILTPDSNNIAENIEYPVTWWAPGQYIPIGILHTLGFSLGTASIIVSALGLLLFGLGFAALARSMEIPNQSLPWVTAVACSTHYMLYSFGHFIGGETAQIAVWPWAAFTAWTLRKRTIPFIIVLPLVFLIGAFGKHSFAIYSLAILVFLWAEALRDAKARGYSPTSLRLLWSASYPIVCVGILFILGRHFLIDTSHTPGTQGMTDRNFWESLGFSFFGPIFGLLGIDRIVGYLSYHFFGIKSEDAWTEFSPTLSLLSPLPLALYVWLTLRRALVDRIAGITALIVGLIFFALLWSGGAISYESRHYQPVAMLLLLALGLRLTDPNRLLSWGSRVILTSIVLFGCATLLQRHLNMASPQTHLSYAKAENIMCDLPQPVQKILQRLAGEENSIIVATDPGDILITNRSRHPTTRFMLIDIVNPIERHGRAPRLAFAMRAEGVDLERAPIIRESFKDYDPEEWTSYEVDGWVIWQAGDVIPLREAETERS
ncbi:hypothetical protein [Cephaloticoccus capnophilus]|uniref:hypothetical protein n=1 Tax=Cephaloticoccus capnophilus TaxID=1548208 RepID=UPI0012E86954|nr:hypothetical protein [Cephaloticoccus capnophilus]